MLRHVILISVATIVLIFALSGTGRVRELRNGSGYRLSAATALSPAPQTQSASDVVWVDDNLPSGASPYSDGGDAWSWVPAPMSGTFTHASNFSNGTHQHLFSNVSFNVGAGDVLFAYVYLNPRSLPSQVMLQWAGPSGWSHRAYWGANDIQWGINNTDSRRYMGPLPNTGGWVRLEVPASQVGLEGLTVNAMAFTLHGGQATWDKAGKSGWSGEVVWIDDNLPSGASPYSDGGDAWSWVPAPMSGTFTHASNFSNGTHQHLFSNVSFNVGAGDVLFAYVYLNPRSLPSQVMLQWAGPSGWSHRAYWGANDIQWGINNTDSRRYMGPLPNTGGWVRLEVPASQVGLEGLTVNAMAFTLHGGQATWDKAGKSGIPQPVVMTVVADDPAAKHNNFKLQTTGYSVIKLPDAYHIYGSTGLQQIRWQQNLDKLKWDNLYHDTAMYPFFTPFGDCSHVKDPRLWGDKCSTDAMGHFWKRVTCGPSNACQDNDWWNSGDNLKILDTYSSPTDSIIWPQLFNRDYPNLPSSYGVIGFNTTIDHAKVNSVDVLPRGTDCHDDAETIWVDDALPGNAQKNDLSSDWNEPWNFVYASPSPTPSWPGAWTPTEVSTTTATFRPPPFPSLVSHQSALGRTGIHQHFFTGAIPLSIADGDRLIAWIYLDPDTRKDPTEIMLQWFDGVAWQRASWGGNDIPWPKKRMGALPPRGVWYRLEVPAADVGLNGKSITGMAFTLFGGQATWDRAGKTTPLPPRTCPPKSRTSPSDSMHAYNPDDYATGASNSKAVVYKYPDGRTRYFMTFNRMIKKVSPSYIGRNPLPPYNVGLYNDSFYGRSAADNWEVMWATSNDGKNWTVHPQILFRSVSQAQDAHLGLLVTDMIIDEGYFYILMTDLKETATYMVRARVNPTYSATGTGYIDNSSEGWSVAGGQQANGEYSWIRLNPLGTQFDFRALGAQRLMQASCTPGTGPENCYFVFQASMARIFSATSPGTSKIFAVSNDVVHTQGDRLVVKLWSTPSLSRPFTYESEVVFEQYPNGVPVGGHGWEFGFNHYSDNTAATPRIVGSGFDVWFTTNERPLNPPENYPPDRGIVLGRHTARLSNF